LLAVSRSADPRRVATLLGESWLSTRHARSETLTEARPIVTRR
jgi:hypothetical protein